MAVVASPVKRDSRRHKGMASMHTCIFGPLQARFHPSRTKTGRPLLNLLKRAQCSGHPACMQVMLFPQP